MRRQSLKIFAYSLTHIRSMHIYTHTPFFFQWSIPEPLLLIIDVNDVDDGIVSGSRSQLTILISVLTFSP